MSKIYPTHAELEEEVDFYIEQFNKIIELEEDIDFSEETEVGLLLKAIDIAKDAIRRYGL